MLEMLGNIILGILVLAVLVGLLAIMYVLYLCLGWLFIILWLVLGAPPGDFLFMQAMVSLAVYGGTGLVLVLAYAFYSEHDDLPPALRLLAQFLPAPLKREVDAAVDLPDLATRTKAGLLSPFTHLEKKFQTWRYQQAAEDLRVDTDYQRAQAELHEAAQEFNREKLRAEEAERARGGHD